MTRDNLHAHIGLEIHKGDQALREAEVLLDVGLFNGAVARAYYAAFHYACAALVSVDIQVRSHQGLQTLFSLHLVKTDKLPFRYARDLKQLQAFREAADYDASFQFDKPTAERELDVARGLGQAIRAFLNPTA